MTTTMTTRSVSVSRAGVVFTLLALVAVPLRAGPESKPREEKDHLAEKVAKKVEHARRKAEKAEAELAEKDREALKDFQKEVREYAHLHAKQLAKLGPPDPGDAQAGIALQKALAAAIRAKRDAARQGDIFRRGVEPIFRRLLAAELKGPVALPAREAVREGNPKHETGSVQVLVRVNAEYPLGAPLSTVPPSLLLTLPPLPAPLEYRFVGRDLILFDSVAGLIVDFLAAAAPNLGGPVNP